MATLIVSSLIYPSHWQVYVVLCPLWIYKTRYLFNNHPQYAKWSNLSLKNESKELDRPGFYYTDHKLRCNPKSGIIV